MPDIKLTLAVLPERFAVCRLGPSEDVPAWATRAAVFSVTRTRDELSIVCPEENVPADARCAKGWRALRLVGTFDFAMTGILASIIGPLARVGVSIFSFSTYDTDYVMVREDQLEKARKALIDRGHTIEP